MNSEIVYKLKVAFGTVLIITGFVMMIVTKAIIRMNPDKDVQKFRIINKIGSIMIKVSAIVFIWAAFGLVTSNPNV